MLSRLHAASSRRPTQPLHAWRSSRLLPPPPRGNCDPTVRDDSNTTLVVAVRVDLGYPRLPIHKYRGERPKMYQPAPAASTEAYGAVSVRRRGHDDGSSSSTSPTGTGHHAQQGATASHLQQQRQMYPNQAHGVPAGSSSYTGASYAAGYPTGPPAAAHARPMQPPRYHHNKSTALILLPPLTCLLLFHPTPHPLIAMLFTSLVLYGLDLANTRDGTALGVWLGFAISSITLLSGLWDDASVGLATIVARVSSSILLLFCLVSYSLRTRDNGMQAHI